MLTTIDTHGPSGFPSASCGESRGMIDAVRCADRLIAEFIEDVRNANPDIVVALFTDHLMGNAGFGDEVTGYLVPNAEETPTALRGVGPDVRSGVIDRPAPNST